MTLDHATQRELLDLLLPFLTSEGERRALLTHVFGEDCPALQQIEWGGSAETFVLRMVEALAHFGEVAPGRQALWKLLETVRERAEEDRKARIGALEPIVNRPVMRADSTEQTPRAALGSGAGQSVPPPLHLRVFLASPGDVANERTMALQALDQLPYDPLLRGRVTVEAVAWDKAGAGAPMLAGLTPQAAIAAGLPRPSACDIVIVILWSRMGTPLPAEYRKPDGSAYLSGTEWEHLEALEARELRGRPEILVYRGTRPYLINADDPDFDEKRRQRDAVKAFFATFRNADGSIRDGYNDYAEPDDFRQHLDLHLRSVVRRLLDGRSVAQAASAGSASQAERVAQAAVPPQWTGSPFPRPRAFTAMARRDGFTAAIRRELAERAGQRCSNPDCQRPTTGPSDDRSSSSTTLGKAAHIAAAARGGPRYDSTLSAQQRASSDNGVWLCAECADRIDKIENESAYPVELLRYWKMFHESATGTDLASAENRRRFPLSRLRIVNFAGVQGEADIRFGALTLVHGGSKLSNYVAEIMRIFGDKSVFEQARQPDGGPTHRVLGPIVVTMAFKPPRTFAEIGRLQLTLSDGREFVCVISSTGSKLYIGDAPLPVYTPVVRTVAMIDNCDRYLYGDEAASAEERIAQYFGISVDELMECIRGVPSDRSLYGLEYRIDSRKGCLVSFGGTHPKRFGSIRSFSSGEKARLFLDLAIRITTYASKISPVTLLVRQRALHPMDQRGIELFLQWIDSNRPPFQTVMDLDWVQTDVDLRNALCYEVEGSDMAVTEFRLVPWASFRDPQPRSAR